MKICPTCKTKYSTNVFFCPLEGSRLVEDLEAGPAKTLVGTILDDRYHVLKKLGEGGMGAVYLVEHMIIKKRMAVKVLRDEYARKEEVVKRFQMEAIAASRIGQENIIDVTDFGRTSEGNAYFIMECLDGPNLADVIREANGIHHSRAVPILRQVCSALSAAHDQGIIHRDLKPENIVLIRRGSNSDFVKILDFGISKMVDMSAGRAEKLTALGMIVGTPEYMSPEQASGQPVDLRTDVYSLGIIMYEMVTGSLPFTADNALQILAKHVNEQPRPPRAARPDLEIPPALEELILRCLSKPRDLRPAAMGEIDAALAAVLEAPSARPAPRKTMTWDSSEVMVPTALRQAATQAAGGLPSRTQMSGSAAPSSPDASPPAPTAWSTPPSAVQIAAPPPPDEQPRAETEPPGSEPAVEAVIPEPALEVEQPAMAVEAVQPEAPPAAPVPAPPMEEAEEEPPARKSRAPVFAAVAAVVIAASAAALYFLVLNKPTPAPPPVPASPPAAEAKPASPPSPPPAPAEAKPAPTPVTPPPEAGPPVKAEPAVEARPEPARKPQKREAEPPKAPERREPGQAAAPKTPSPEPVAAPAPKPETAVVEPAVAASPGEVVIELEASQANVEVYEGGEFIGTTPVKLKGRGGEQKVFMLKKSGYEAKKVQVRFDRPRQVRVDMSPDDGSAKPARKREDLLNKIHEKNNPFK